MAATAPAAAASAMAASRPLSASAKPFTFNPAAKSFVFTPAAVAPPPPPQTKPKITFTHEELFALQPPLYCGSDLEISNDADLSDVLLYDPCFDYIGAGLITAVPVVPVDAPLPSADTTGAGATDGGAPAHDTADAASGKSQRTSPKKTKRTTKSSKEDASNNNSTAAAPVETNHHPAETAGDTSAVTLSAEVVEGGVRQPDGSVDLAPSSNTDAVAAGESGDHEAEEEEDEEEDGEDEEEEDAEEEEEDDYEGEEDGEYAGDGQYAQEGLYNPYSQYSQPQQPQVQYVWTPQAYTYMPGGGDDSFQPSGSPYYPLGTGANQFDDGSAASSAFFPSSSAYSSSSMHPDRRRKFMSHFSSSSSSYPSSSHYPARRGYSPPRHFSSSSSSSSYYPSPPRPPRGEVRLPERVYTRAQLLQLRNDLPADCVAQHAPGLVPPHLYDIFKSASMTNSSSRSLFGHADTAGSGSSRSVFGHPLHANTNHALPGPDVEQDGGGAFSKGARGSKVLKSKRKNKDRTRTDDEDLPAGRGVVPPRRDRLDSVDRDGGDNNEEHAASAASASSRMKPRGLGTPKLKPHKQKKGGKKGGRDTSPHKGNNNNNKRGGGGYGASSSSSGQGLSNFQLDQFADATMADLHHAENAWVPRAAAPLSALAGDLDARIALQKQTLSILNKLSIDKLYTLLDSMASLSISSGPELAGVVDVLFDKSVDEPEFASLYARFCALLAPRMPEFTEHIGAPSSSSSSSASAAGAQQRSGGASTKTYSFRTLLLTRCYKLLVEDEESLRQSLYATALANERAKEGGGGGGGLGGFSLNGPVVANGGSGSCSPRLTASPRLAGMTGLTGTQLIGSSASRSTSPARITQPVGTGGAGGGSPSLRPSTRSPRLLSATTSPLIGASSSPLELPLVSELELAERLRLLQVHQRGNLVFIGELFKQRMLPHSVVHLCLDALLDSAGDVLAADNDGSGGELIEPNEADVEAVCTFLACVGGKLEAAAQGLDDEDESSLQSMGTEAFQDLCRTRRELLEGHFNKVRALSRCRGLASRFRFMLQDLLDLRARSWVPRLAKTVDPRSLTEIREAAATPQHAQQKQNYWGANAMTSARKGAHKPAMMPAAAAAAAAAAAGPRTTVKGPSSMRANAPSFATGGRTLQFGASSPMKRAISAPDHKEDMPDFLPLPSAPVPSDGRYVPMWQRRALGLGEREHGLRPRSDADSAAGAAAAATTSSAAAAAGDLIAEGEATELSDDDLAAGGDTGMDTEEGLTEEDEGAPVGPTLSEDDVLHELTTLVEELFSAHDVIEALQCIAEVEPHCASTDSLQRTLLPLLMSKCVEQASSAGRALAPAIMHELCVQQRLTPTAMHQGIADWLLLLGDVAIDIPHAPSHSHGVFAKLVHQGHLPLRRLISLYAASTTDDVVPLADAAAWSIDTLVQLRALCDSDSALEQLMLASADELPTPLAPLFADDRAAAQRALEAAKLPALCYAALL